MISSDVFFLLLCFARNILFARISIPFVIDISCVRCIIKWKKKEKSKIFKTTQVCWLHWFDYCVWRLIRRWTRVELIFGLLVTVFHWIYQNSAFNTREIVNIQKKKTHLQTHIRWKWFIKRKRKKRKLSIPLKYIQIYMILLHLLLSFEL